MIKDSINDYIASNIDSIEMTEEIYDKLPRKIIELDPYLNSFKFNFDIQYDNGFIGTLISILPLCFH